MPRVPTTSDAFSAIADPGRRRILTALGTDEATVGELVERLGMTQPQVSKHLGVLREVDLVTVRPDGKHRVYRVNGPTLKPVHAWVESLADTWNERLDRLEDVVRELQEQEETP